MKSIFLNERQNMIQYVYSDDEITHLHTLIDLDDKIYSKADLLNDPQKFKDVEYVFSTWGMPIMDADEIKTCLPSLKCVFYAAGTVQYFARPFLELGIQVFSAWAANAVPVAEYTVAQIILANKGFYTLCELTSRGNRDKAKEKVPNYIGNYGARIGIIGAGMIGRLVIKMLRSYELSVSVFDPFLPDETAKELSVTKTSLEQLFCECNVISNHLANNEQTKGMLDYKLFSSMRPYSTFINTGRGAQVVEPDLIRALREREDITALLDVTYPEPPLPDCEFYNLKNCFLTPHIAGSSGQEVHRMAKYMTDEFESVLKNRKCNYEVTLKMLETMA